jgi:hypothetical protein
MGNTITLFNTSEFLSAAPSFICLLLPSLNNEGVRLDTTNKGIGNLMRG